DLPAHEPVDQPRKPTGLCRLDALHVSHRSLPSPGTALTGPRPRCFGMLRAAGTGFSLADSVPRHRAAVSGDRFGPARGQGLVHFLEAAPQNGRPSTVPPRSKIGQPLANSAAASRVSACTIA